MDIISIILIGIFIIFIFTGIAIKLNMVNTRIDSREKIFKHNQETNKKQNNI